MIRLIAAVSLLVLSQVTIAATGNVNVFTDHQVIHMVNHGVNKYDDVQFPTGKVPYLGRVGLEYEVNRWTYSLAYIHRSNADISGNEYNYDGVAAGIKYTYCIINC